MRFSWYFLSIKNLHTHTNTSELKKEKSWKIYDLSRQCIRCFAAADDVISKKLNFLRSSSWPVCCFFSLLMIYWRKSHQDEGQENVLICLLSALLLTEKTILFRRGLSRFLCCISSQGKDAETWSEILWRYQEEFFDEWSKFFVKNRLIFNFIFIFRFG